MTANASVHGGMADQLMQRVRSLFEEIPLLSACSDDPSVLGLLLAK